MSSSLSERQQDDLHKAILDYLHSGGYTKTYEQFKEEVPKFADFSPEANQKASGLLVKKWTSVIRMQKKIMDLETRLTQALEENSHMSHLPNGSAGGKSNDDWIPTAGPKHTLTGHREAVNTVAFHPLYSVVASASDDCTVKIWDWETGELERTLKAHTKRVSDCQFNSKGTMLVTCGYDLFIKLWNVENDYQNSATLRGHEHSISSARFLPGDDKIVSSSRDQTLRIWDLASTHCIKVLNPHEAWIRCAVPSPDGRYVIACASDHTAKIVDVNSGEVKVEFRGHENVVEVAELCPPHTVANVRELIALKSPENVPAVTNASIVFAVTGSRDMTIKIWDAIRGQCLHTLVGHDSWIRALVFHPNGQYLLSASDDHTFRVWDLKTGRCIRKVEAHDQFVNSMSWGRQRVGAQTEGSEARLVNVIATSGNDQTVKIWVPQR
ncbi:platelet-activating factor acetylhydrolase ib alpha subunit [Moniliophthora roreri MCA 2997]|uniref:Nuclear distribution protein PAC1 n=2 Tax=Moniliophthora roreri TaxID=221103 RepID=V2XXU6_MONRO|nr:platelet-activating factor acetylhydrolase ib alpha subunit [Moniliophthora roreri MCA 2997]KAI3618926.1 platelet-activating factor acetylhydrolase ib alpha subunit [Moniliophthora roreri]